jgi:hypothetical protein
MRKITVVTDENGRVVATQLGHGDVPDAMSGVVVSLAAGPGQRLHKIEFEVPQLGSRGDVESFHEQLGKHLGRP